MKISPSRVSSFEILQRIEKEKAFSSVLLPQYEKNLSPKDRALCHQLTLGTLRQQIYLDQIIQHFVTKRLDLEVRIALRLGAYQMLFLDKIPVYSIINESVNLVQRAKKTSAKGLVNAILRKIASEKVELKFTDEIEKVSLETSHPRWLVERWISQFGIEETGKLCQANNETPDLDFRATQKTSAETRKQLENLTRGELFELAEKGEIYFQDKSSQMVAKSIALKNGEKILDVCCAPGGKLSLIAENESSNSSELMIGGDLYHQRLVVSRDNCRRQGVENIHFVQYDAENSLPFAENNFDVILIDAPCSGTGTIRHNPEIKYFLVANDICQLALKQLKILENASKLLRTNGRLIYSTCSLEIEENEQVIEKFLNLNPEFLKQNPNVAENFLTGEGFGRTFPHHHRTDGFFIAELKKY